VPRSKAFLCFPSHGRWQDPQYDRAGLLAKHPEIRKKIIGDLYDTKGLGEVRVVAFTGARATPLSAFGELSPSSWARRKRSRITTHRCPHQADSLDQPASGPATLILLDELAPYFEDASRSQSVIRTSLGNDNALSNLLVAVGKDALANVCVVISDLKATHKSGTTQLNEALSDFEAEVGRGAMTLEPVGLNTDEIYHILRTRLLKAAVKRTSGRLHRNTRKLFGT